MNIVVFKTITPSRLLIPLRYRWQTTQLTNGTAPNASKTLRVNAAYDVDVTIGSTAATGFTEYAAMFKNYRVRRIDMNVNACNTEAISMECCLALSTDFFSSNAFDRTFFFNRNCVVKRAAKNGGQDTVSLSISRTLEQIVGDSSVTSDSDYASLVTGVPTTLVYGIFAIDSGNNSFTMNSNGFQCTWEVTMWTEFYAPKMLIT
jgi:hypothetical protein